MLAAVPAEARAALVGDCEESTDNRLTQPNRFGPHEHHSCDDREPQSPVFDVGDHARTGATKPGALVSDQRARARQFLRTILQRARGDA